MADDGKRWHSDGILLKPEAENIYFLGGGVCGGGVVPGRTSSDGGGVL